jgi:hypothetical protein
MYPNFYLHENLLAQRSQELDHKLKYRYLLADQPRQRLVTGRRGVALLGSLLVALGSRLQQLEQDQQHEPVAYHR